MLPVIFLIQGCKTPQAPRPPKVTLYQPIINSKVCENGSCQIISVCKQWDFDEKENKWVLTANHDISKCNGIFGVTADDFNKIRDFSREMQSYIENNCGTKPN